jgi:hypothetical protein
MLQFLREKGQSLPVKLRPGKERLTSVEREGNPVLTEIIEPCHHLFDSLYAHDRGAFLRTPAITALGRTPQRRDEHHVKRIFHYTFFLSLGYNCFHSAGIFKKTFVTSVFPVLIKSAVQKS